jgi:hypothetical protein
MIKVITKLMEKVIIPKYGPLVYAVEPTSKFPALFETPGFVVSILIDDLRNLGKEKSKSLIDDIKGILQMLGFINTAIYDGKIKTHIIATRIPDENI